MKISVLFHFFAEASVPLYLPKNASETEIVFSGSADVTVEDESEVAYILTFGMNGLPIPVKSIPENIYRLAERAAILEARENHRLERQDAKYISATYIDSIA